MEVIASSYNCPCECRERMRENTKFEFDICNLIIHCYILIYYSCTIAAVNQTNQTIEVFQRVTFVGATLRTQIRIMHCVLLLPYNPYRYLQNCFVVMRFAF